MEQTRVGSGAGLAILLLAACSSLKKESVLDEVTRMHISAVGGQTNLEAVKTLEYALHILDAKLPEADAIYRVTRDGRMRIDIVRDGTRVYTEAFDGERAWDMDEKGNIKEDAAGAALWHGTQFPGQILDLLDLPSRGHQVTYAGRERLDGIDYHVLEIRLRDGFVTYRYLNPTSWLIERGRDFRAFHPALEARETWVETRWCDYRLIAGVMRAFVSTSTDLHSGAWLSTTTITGIKVNPVFDAAEFTAPVADRTPF